MGEYVDVAGHPTWLHRCGSGSETILLLHGGLSCSEELLTALEEPLGSSYELVAFDRKGHGWTADTDEPFHYESMADEVIAVVELLGGGPVHVVGWSDGGIAALLASRRRPDLIARQVLIGTNFHHDGIVLDGLAEDPGVSAGMAESYGRRSPDGRDHFPVVLEKFNTLARTEPTLAPGDLAAVATPTLVLVGDDDMVALAHTVALFEGLRAGQLAVVPGASHAVPVEKPALVAGLITEFLQGPVPPPTALPVRRAPARS
ncbi:Pimeloyl-ACP methyl ester carboxylesterase [Nocardioides terrae]|uniref:Pimeloyl-ACP methyl ester carboxylesterase n=1 Tax=Nocardioides terrae TaxID=574651 RepID=A0A1I1GAY6_9ACTN|nr:alpha/beta hydrolase [Nocardioides terrae]SFC08731.1 Pimeloyl-ACP methyl ester carboxylesterase [Nocardioides terrae]